MLDHWRNDADLERDMMTPDEMANLYIGEAGGDFGKAWMDGKRKGLARDIQSAIDAAVKAEREAAAEICELHSDWRWLDKTYGVNERFKFDACCRAVDAIRQRGEQ